MESLYTAFISFILIFISELGDKTQLLVISFSSKLKTFTILFGVAIGSLFSHGLAIVFGSNLGLLNNFQINVLLKFITYISFIILGFFTIFSKKENNTSVSAASFINKLSKYKVNYIFLIALSIIVGEFGDKTFLSSIGLGIQYPEYKIPLIIGAIFGMVLSDFLAIVLGKFLFKRISSNFIEKISGFIFMIFGFLGLFTFLFNS